MTYISRQLRKYNVYYCKLSLGRMIMKDACAQRCQTGCMIERVNAGHFNGFDAIERLADIFDQTDELHEITTSLLEDGSIDFEDDESLVSDFEESLNVALGDDAEDYAMVTQQLNNQTIAEYGEPHEWIRRMHCAKSMGAHTVKTFVDITIGGDAIVETWAFPYEVPIRLRKLGDKELYGKKH